MIRKLLYALRSGLFDAAVVPVVVGKYTYHTSGMAELQIPSRLLLK
jgi:hypothetical protein